MTQQSRVSPFHCGTQFADWTASNCERCKKAAPPDGSWPTCEIEAALTEAYIMDGTVTAEIAQRMNYQPLAYNWRCGEVDWTDEWKATVNAQKKEKAA